MCVLVMVDKMVIDQVSLFSFLYCCYFLLPKTFGPYKSLNIFKEL